MGPGDEPVQIDNEIPGNAENNLLCPPQLKSIGYQLEINVYKGDIIEPNADYGSEVDPYVKLEFVGAKVQTKALNNQWQPEWNEKLLIPVCLPIAADKIVLSVWDEDHAGDDKICTHYFSFTDIQNNIENYETPF